MFRPMDLFVPWSPHWKGPISHNPPGCDLCLETSPFGCVKSQLLFVPQTTDKHVRIIASIEDPAVIEKILTHLERRQAAGVSPHAPRAPPANSSGDSP